MSAASPVGRCCGRTSATIDVLTVEQPAMVGCLQIQPVETIHVPPDVEPKVRREQVPIFFDAAPATVHPLRERLFLSVPAQAGLGQGRGLGVVLVAAITAGAFSLATDHLHEQSRCPVPHTARGVFLPCDVIELLARDVDAGRTAGWPAPRATSCGALPVGGVARPYGWWSAWPPSTVARRSDRVCGCRRR
jgi:hypothetical protein